MTAYQQARTLFSKMSLEDKVELLRDLIREISPFGTASGIEKTPNICGGDACIIRTRIPVWLLVSLRKNGWTDAELLASYPTLRAEDLVNAWNYFADHSQEIDLAIQEQETV